MAKTTENKDFLSKVDFAADQVLFEEGSDADVFLVVEAGVVQLTKKIHSQTCSLGTLVVGDVLGEEAFFPDTKYGYTAKAIENTRCLRVVGRQFEEMVRRSPEIAVRLLRKLAMRLIHAQFRLSNFTLLSPTARLMHQLVAERERASNDTVPIPYDLPEVLGLEKGALDGMMRTLVQERLVALTKKGDAFQIPDRDAFDRYLTYLELRDRFHRLDEPVPESN